jgi:hypothetical protein
MYRPWCHDTSCSNHGRYRLRWRDEPGGDLRTADACGKHVAVLLASVPATSPGVAVVRNEKVLVPRVDKPR